MKFDPHRPDLVDAVWAAKTPGQACEIARNRTHPLKKNWEEPVTLEGFPNYNLFPNDEVYRPGVKPEPCIRRWKDCVMFEVVLAKFTQHEDLKREILSTGTQALVENALHDPYWGWGASHVGENKLGRILMVVREALRS
jgi:predicted NAD-dependent protein-ADP-ribosyltransferase YbiA (DUF1768 family)